ncbi:isopentenyl-diphosphate delta-isomerase [Paenibacillus cellulosilyticus]|uniref:Isopentenyl-diphosphate delta-isomerase n=1 Tax=Paenibacillus cellulosilyticus TaxID=375489 RepID=A0A2V2YGW7_9BACL|nr:type 2 isopentenyl-diphosphate Delta-isomerase [Paenibacillus cellulosilyticus]PWV92061.1 isopentenyl-diphosphate delta-isomerase [Paenibacillus cellulosilyticus]QKS46742.1 type 2 isopentenyl-diphosphate Delta-isomerase [Paenibacillus cellulosilyticus]
MTNQSRETAEQAALTAKRKGEHIRICLQEDVEGEGITAGFERYRFEHCALPELQFETISLAASFLGKKLSAPLLVSSMTGGTEEASAINVRLAEAAEARGWAIGLGSMRAAIESEDLADSFRVRHVAPTAPVIANLGAVQLALGYGVDQCRRAVELAEADALVLHLNGMQELFQPEGDTDFSGLLERIREVCHRLEMPVGVKEVGWGIDGRTARKLYDAGVSFIDIAGAGGTSWSQVEKFRTTDPMRRAAAEAFADWGIPTADSISDVRRHLPYEAVVIGSGGLKNGVEAAKAIALGANIVGFGRTLLPYAARAGDSGLLHRQFEQIEFELRASMFGIGAASIQELAATERLQEKNGAAR